RVEGSGAVLCGPVERIVAATPMTAAAVKATVRKVAGRAPAVSSSFAAIALTVAAALWAPGQPAYAQAPAPGAPLRIARLTPAGQDAPAPRQIVVQFDRPVVPLGRMDRRADELPIEIEPALDCAWRWLDRSALACELGDGERAQLATRYRITVSPGLEALDGAELAEPVEHTFATARPRLEFAGFSTWRGPGTPVIRAVFSQPVTEP